jgi:hypothetical protein
MKLFDTNPYRILGIKSNAGPAEKEKARNTILAYLKIGKEPVLDFDLCPPLQTINRTAELIDLKSNEILNDVDKITHGIFWFISGGVIDDIALNKLIESKDFDKSRDNFLKGCNSFEITENSICSIINYSTLEIINFSQHKDRERLKSALNNKLSIAFEKDYISFLLRFLNATNSKIDFKEIEKNVLSLCKNLLLEVFPSEDIETLMLEFFKSHKAVFDEYVKEITSKKIQAVKNIVSKSKTEREDLIDLYSNKNTISESVFFKSCGQVGEQLYWNTIVNLTDIKKSLGISHTSTTMIYEAVMDELNFCGVLAMNSFMDKFSSASESRKKEIVQTLTPEDFDPIISMTSIAIESLGDVSTTILTTMRENLASYKDTQNTIRNKGSGGGGDSGLGCLGEIIGRIIVYALIAGFLGFIMEGC